MIATAEELKAEQGSCEDVGQRFLAMLPQIEKLACRACRGEGEAAQEDFVAEVIANAYCAFAQLAKRGRLEIAYPTPLATFAIRQVRCGRRVGGRLNAEDISSGYCQATKRIKVGSLVERDEATGQWREILVEDKRSTPADVAAVRIDFVDWLRSLGRKQRRIATALACGETTRWTARKFGLSPGRISQLRSELRLAWQRFQGEAVLA
jgi:hypothetical protein